MRSPRPFVLRRAGARLQAATERLLAAIALTAAAALLLSSDPAAGSSQESGRALTLRMIAVTSAEAAQRIVERLNGGESFALLARSESTAPSADLGGWLGRVPVLQLRPEVRTALEGLTPGHITPVIRIPTGFAIFKVEEDEPSEETAKVGAALASSGAVKYVYDVGGFTDARLSLETLPKPPEWNMDPRAICDARTQSLAATRARVEAYLSADNQALAAQPAIDVMQLHFGLGQLDAFEGRMDRAIARFAEAQRVAASQVPTGTLQMEEALGIAYLHKAGLDNDVFTAPGELCLLTARPARSYPRPADAEKAVDHFLRYLEQKPDDLEVRWLLNIAAMAVGAYPGKVPAKFLIPPSVFQSAEDVGRFRDVAPEAGLTIFAAAGGALVDDFRNTGRLDVVASTADKCGSMRMLGSNGDGTFADRTADANLTSQLGGLNTVQGDYNNDGCPDILILRGGWEELPQRKSLLKNNCNGTFTDVTSESGLAAPATSTQTAVWTDFDNDGFLDLFVGNENAPAQLFRNTRNGTFEDVAKAAGVDAVAYSKGVTAGDYDNDRFPDLFVSNYGGTNFLYHNNRNGTFTEFSAAARVLGTPQGFATWFFDYNNDGWQDLFVTSYVASLDEMVRDYLGMPHNATTMRLYRNSGDGAFRDVTVEAGLDRVRMPMGSNFGDIDNDGFLDMFLGTGNPSYGALAGSVLLRNKDGRAFVDVTGSSGTGELHRGHGVGFADLDNDGDEDIVFEVGGVTPGDRHALRLFENPGHGNDWIAVKLVGVKTNRSAVGARITAVVEDEKGQRRSIHRTVTTGGSFGSSPLTQHIGLGKSARVVDVDIWWPTSDTRQHFPGVGKNQWLQIEEFGKQYTVLKREPVKLGGSKGIR
jgi:FG-GAP-like repeat/PPIC-type PPIASE domain/ASPIC and UnbV